MNLTEQEAKRIRKISQLLSAFFNNNQIKVAMWMSTANPLLGNVKPMQMVKAGRSDKLLQFIETNLSENVQKRPMGRKN